MGDCAARGVEHARRMMCPLNSVSMFLTQPPLTVFLTVHGVDAHDSPHVVVASLTPLQVADLIEHLRIAMQPPRPPGPDVLRLDLDPEITPAG